MNILFVRKYPLVDGTFTLVLRLAKELKSRGHQCYFLKFDIDYEASLLAEINESCILLPQEKFESPENFPDLPAIDVIFGIIGGDLLLWTYHVLKNKFFPQAAVVFGFYHPRAYIDKSVIGTTTEGFFYRWFFRRIPARNLVFMNEAVLKTHRHFLKNKFGEANLIPLPVVAMTGERTAENINRDAIISVGRLVDFKNYVIPVINIIAELNSRGYDFSFHIYGEGPLREKIENEIKQCQAERFIFLHGSLPYDQFNAVLQDKLLFIGMGTALVEAAAAKVPALMAIESNEEPTTYGWLSEVAGGHVGEVIEGRETKPIDDYILEAYKASAQQYQAIAEACYAAAGEFSISNITDHYLQVFAGADKTFTLNISPLKQKILKLLRQPYKLLRLKKYKAK